MKTSQAIGLKALNKFFTYVVKNRSNYPYLYHFMNLYRDELETRIKDFTDVVDEFYPSDFEKLMRDLITEVSLNKGDDFFKRVGGIEDFLEIHDPEGSYSEYLIKEEFGWKDEKITPELRARVILRDMLLYEADKLFSEFFGPELEVQGVLAEEQFPCSPEP